MSDQGDNRNLTTADVTAIVTELKAQLLKDFQLEVARGVMIWVKKAFVVLLLILAVQGFTGDRTFLQSFVTTK